MPQFFDRNNLTPEQQSRWDWAMAEYERVLADNLDKVIEAMPPDKKDALMIKYREMWPDYPSTILDYMKRMQALMGWQAGHPKSALFARLLEGKQALPSPPPTSYSYPWYDIIEKEGVYRVHVGGIEASGDKERGMEWFVGINQDAWRVVSMNDAAKKLVDLQSDLSVSAKDDKESGHTWSTELLEGVLTAYEQRPEFIVRYGQWADYRLRIGRGESSCRLDYAQDVIGRIANRETDILSNCGNVFDVSRMYLNADIDGAKGGHFVAISYDDWVLEKVV